MNSGSGSPDAFSSLCGFSSFVTNSDSVLTLSQELTPGEVSVLSSLLVSGAEISHLVFCKELPHGTGTQLGAAMKCSRTLHKLTLGPDRREQEDPALVPELLHAVEVSANPALKQLITRRGMDATEFNSFAGFISLRRLAIMSGGMVNIPSLAAGIGKLRLLESLHIRGIMFGDTDGETLVAVLKDLPLLTELGIHKARDAEKAVKSIGRLVALGRITSLSFENAGLDDGAIYALRDAIVASQQQRECQLQRFSLRGNCFNPKSGQKGVAGLVAHLPHLRTLNVHSNSLDESFGKALRPSARSLEELDISECGLGPAETASVLEALHDFRALRVLKMGYNDPGDLGSRALSQLLPISCGQVLIELRMESSHITEAQAMEFSPAFSKFYMLQHIYLSNNDDIGPKGGAAIMDALNSASKVPMETIQAERCNIGDEGAAAVGRLIMGRGCKAMYLANNSIEFAGAKSIADAVVVSACTVEYIGLEYNQLSDEGMQYFLDKLAKQGNTNVRKYNIEGNKTFRPPEYKPPVMCPPPSLMFAPIVVPMISPMVVPTIGPIMIGSSPTIKFDMIQQEAPKVELKPVSGPSMPGLK